MKQSRTETGFTLFEMLLAMVVFSLLMLSLSEFQRYILRKTEQIKEIHQLINEARNLLENYSLPLTEIKNRVENEKIEIYVTDELWGCRQLNVKIQPKWHKPIQLSRLYCSY